MRQILKKQQTLTPVWGSHQHSKELQTISEVLDHKPEIAELAHGDIVGDAQTDTGRDGLSGEQVIRMLLIRKIHDLSYRDLEFHLSDSIAFRSFCRLGLEQQAPNYRTLNRNIKRLRPETLIAINQALVDFAVEAGIDKGRKVRSDTTVVETNIHPPTDSGLLFDCVRVLTRLLGQADARIKSVTLNYSDHTLRAKRRALGVQTAKNRKLRLDRYKDLIKVSEKVQSYGMQALSVLHKTSGITALALATELEQVLEQQVCVLDQTRRRVLLGESVPANEKIFSIFERHTDIIKKEPRKVEYGHKVCLTGGVSGLVSDCWILEGNPADSDLATEGVKRQIKLYNRPPRQIAFDGGFTSSDNLKAIKKLKVKDVCFHKKRGLEISDMVKSA